MSAHLDQTAKRDRSASDAGPWRAKLKYLPAGSNERDVRALLGDVAVTSTLFKNHGRVAIVTLPDEDALKAVLALDGRNELEVKIGKYHGVQAPPPRKAAATDNTKRPSRGAPPPSTGPFSVGAPDMTVTGLAKDDIAALDVFDMSANARVVVATSRADADRAVAELREALRGGAGRVQGVDCVGFDTETKPVFRKGQPPNNVALVQLAVRGLIVLIRLDRVGAFPEALRRLLEDAAVLKVGVGCAGDDVVLRRRCAGLDARGSFFDVGKLAKAKFPGLRACGLRALVATLANKRMSKAQQTANWEQPSYTPAMVRYAANDAAAGLLCLELLLPTSPPGPS